MARLNLFIFLVIFDIFYKNFFTFEMNVAAVTKISTGTLKTRLFHLNKHLSERFSRVTNEY